MRSKATVALLLATVIFQHFELGQIGSFRVTAALVTGTALVFLASRRLHVARLVLVWCAIVGLASLTALFAAHPASAWDFFTTLALALLASLYVVAASEGLRSEVLRDVRRAAYLALHVVVWFSVAQVVLGTIDSDALFNPFGAFQFQYQYKPQLEYVLVPRAQGFFLEPSYDAFVIGALAVALLCSGHHFRSTVVIAFIGLAVCQSATGLILFLILAALLTLKSRPSVALPIVIVGGAAIALLGSTLLSRLGSIGDVGSSGNYRLIAPLEILEDILLGSPLGLPLGSIYDVVAQYDLVMIGVEQTVSLDNGVYVIVYYFGWVGIGFLCVLAAWAVRSVLSKPPYLDATSKSWVAPPWIFGSLLFSGGIVAPEFAIMTWLVLASFISAREKKGVVEDAVTNRNFSHLQRSNRP